MHRMQTELCLAVSSHRQFVRYCAWRNSYQKRCLFGSVSPSLYTEYPKSCIRNLHSNPSAVAFSIPLTSAYSEILGATYRVLHTTSPDSFSLLSFVVLQLGYSSSAPSTEARHLDLSVKPSTRVLQEPANSLACTCASLIASS
jgi:hypothetical protein